LTGGARTPSPISGYMRILKSLQLRLLEVQILNGLWAGNFGQNPVKRGICPEVRILMSLREETPTKNTKRQQNAGATRIKANVYLVTSVRVRYLLVNSDLRLGS
jgi:hypothetical protein